MARGVCIGVMALASLVMVSAAQAQRASARPGGVVPLRAGLVVVSAVFNEDIGDYESTKVVSAATIDRLTVRFAGQRVRVSRDVRRIDLDSARVLRASFNEEDDDLYPGTTVIGVSSVVLRELISTGRSTFALQVDDSGPHRGTLERVSGPRTMRVLVNDAPTDLPVVSARAKLDGDDASLVVLDDAANPLVLQFRFADRKLDVIRISYPTDESRIENALAKSRRAVVYGIYFDFASDRIRPESDAVLKEIADVLRRNPGWSLSVEGHTDSIGNDDDNQALSERRAAAVRQVLVQRHGIPAARLTTAGFGETRPQDTNETLQGRARNRRVELIRP